MRKEKHIADFFGYTERSIFRFKSSDNEQMKQRYNALSSYPPFKKYFNKKKGEKCHK